MTRLIALLFLVGYCVFLPSPAEAGCHREDEVQLVQGMAQINTHYVCDGDTEAGIQSASHEQPPRDSDLDALCVQEALSLDTSPFTFCDVPQDVVTAAAPDVTPGLVADAFRRIDLPESDLIVQPPGGRTLVNFETNFYTENGEFTRTVTLLGQRVDLRIWPASFGWRFGDGATKVTSSAGSPYPDLEITHRYLSRGRVSPSVDTTYAAEFRVNDGPWRDVAGTVTIPGSPEGLRVVTARPVLVGN